MLKTKWKELTSKDKKYIKSIYNIDATHKEKIEIIQGKYGPIEDRTVRKWWERLGVGKEAIRLSPDLIEASKHVIPEDSDILFVTSAQNDSPISKGQLKNMEVLAKFIKDVYNKKVSIVVCTVNYRNPTTLLEKDSEKRRWDKDILKYLYYDKLYFNDCIISAKSRVQSTAKNPLSGFETIANGNHLILGHPKFQMRVLLRPKGDDVHIMTTTGSLTRKNYSDSRIGEHGEVHHVYGFTIIEKSENDSTKCLIPRFVNCTSDGDFIDLHWQVKNGKVIRNESCDALILGDIHNARLDNELFNKTIRIFNDIKPKNVFVHDLTDATSVNPHEVLDLYIKKRKIENGDSMVMNELDKCTYFAKCKLTRIPANHYYIVESNHDVFFDRWVNNFNWKQDLHNSEAYLMLAGLQQGQGIEYFGNVFGTYLMQECKKDENNKIQYLPYGSNVKIDRIICSMHGDFGASGAKGSVASFGRLSMKSYTAHTHSHEVFNGAYCVGCSCVMDQYYTRKGLTKWSQGHGVIYSNGKRQQLIFDKNYEITTIK